NMARQRRAVRLQLLERLGKRVVVAAGRPERRVAQHIRHAVDACAVRPEELVELESETAPVSVRRGDLVATVDSNEQVRGMEDVLEDSSEQPFVIAELARQVRRPAAGSEVLERTGLVQGLD